MRSYKDLDIVYQGGNVIVNYRRLDSLAGCPEHITGHFNCMGNSLKSLVGGPQKVDGHYTCYSNHLTDLTGCASHIGGGISCGSNIINSLVGIHKIIKKCYSFNIFDERVIYGGIGLLLIENLTDLTDETLPFRIIKSYLGTGTKGMMECSKELISTGYTNHAKL